MHFFPFVSSFRAYYHISVLHFIAQYLFSMRNFFLMIFFYFHVVPEINFALKRRIFSSTHPPLQSVLKYAQSMLDKVQIWDIFHTKYAQWLSNEINNCRNYEPIPRPAIVDQHCNRSILKCIIYHIQSGFIRLVNLCTCGICANFTS